jgi:hypothetical protein
MNPKLKALPLEALFQLRDELIDACRARKYEAFKVGRLAQFEKAGRGIKGIVTIRITGFGPKNIQGLEVDPDTGLPSGRGGSWRCDPDSLTPIFPKKVAPKPLQGVGADRPMSPMAGSF